MRRKHYEVECLETFTHVTPATVLEVISTVTQCREFIGEVPETRTEYVAGQRVAMRSHRAMRDFCKAHAGKFREVVIA